MEFLLRSARALLSVVAFECSAFAGSVQLLDGTVHQGEVSLDGGLLVRGTPSVKAAFNHVLIARFSDEAAGSQIPAGLVLTNGSSIAGSFTSLFETTVQFNAKGIRIPGGEVAWAVYNPFDSALAADLPAGKTGALLPGGDFFEGSIKSANAESAKILNSIFGPRIFAAAAKDLHAVILRPVIQRPAAFEVISKDGSRYLAMDVLVREGGVLTVRHPLYDGLRLAASDLLEVRAAPSRMIAVAATKPTSAQGNYATTRANGSALKIGEQQVLGCSLADGSSATWKKTVRGGTFVARVAAALEPGTGGKLLFVVEADGRVVFRSPPVGAGDVPQLIRFPMPPAEALTLRVEGGVGGQGIWADPVILLK